MTGNDNAKPEADRQSELYAMLQDATTLDDVDLVLQHLNDAGDQIASMQAWMLTRSAFELSQEFVGEETDKVGELAILYLLPKCQRASHEPKDEVEDWRSGGMERYQARQFLLNWLNAFPAQQMVMVRSVITSHLYEALIESPTEDDVLLISKIGFRGDDVVDRLWRIVETKEVLFDAALSALIALGPNAEDKKRILEIVSDQIAEGKTSSSIQFAVQELVGQDDIAIAEQLLALVSDSAKEDSAIDDSFVVSVITRAIDRCEITSDVHDRVWKRLRTKFKSVNMTSEYGYRCSSKLVVKDYLHWFLDRGIGDGTNAGEYILLSRLRDMVKPTHLSAWTGATSPLMMQRLSDALLRDTHNNSDYHTVEQDVKKEALETMLALGYTDLQELVVPAVLHETSAYASSDVADALACLALSELPGSFYEAIVKNEHFDDTENRHLFRQKGLHEIARSSGSRQAFDAMLRFGFTREGNVLLSTIAATTDLAVARIRQGDTDIIDEIAWMASSGGEKHHRDAAISVFCALASNNLVPEASLGLLWDIASNNKFESYSRGEALVAIGRTDFEAARSWKEPMVEIAKSGEKRLSWQAWEAVLRRGWLADKDEPVLFDQLGIDTSVTSYCLRNAKSMAGWQAYLLGYLYVQDNARFEPCVIDCLDHSSAEAVYQLTPGLKHVGTKASFSIVEALIRRIDRSNTNWMSDSGLFELLGTISENGLFALANDVDWHDWMTEGKYALCEAIRNSAKERKGTYTIATQTFVEFMTDPSFQVRRSAYRACSELSHESLAATCEAWSRLDDIELRKRAAEALSWLPTEYSEQELEDLGFSEDREPTVRQAWKDTLLERRRRSWASSYVDAVLTSASGGNEAIATNYCYSRAIARLGDDDCIRRLRERSNDKELPPNGRHWILKIIKETKKQWKETTSKWPEPWADERDSIEVVDGEISFENNERTPARITLWRQQRRSQNELYSWGGTAVDSSPGFLEIHERKMTLHIPGREPVEVICSGRTWIGSKPSKFAFFGNVAYPEANLKDQADKMK